MLPAWPLQLNQGSWLLAPLKERHHELANTLRRQRFNWWIGSAQHGRFFLRGATMSLSLWMLLGFAAWTLLIMVVGVGTHRWRLIFKGEAALTSFPGDVAHGSPAYRRITRAHANCIENLPVFAVIVLVASVAQINPPPMGSLAAVTLVARIAQSSIHMFLPESNATVAVRFTFFLVQVFTMSAMGYLLVTLAAASGTQ
jgi:uncharacterized MAPEG superfamily protein